MSEGNGSYLHVKNWSKFQHYKSRNPPWIKLHRSLLADYEFSALSDRDKGHLILIWLEAANHDGAVPNDANYLRRRLSLASNPDLKSFINNGWLVETLASTASTKQSREEKNREEGSKPVDNSQVKTPSQYLKTFRRPEFLYKKPSDA